MASTYENDLRLEEIGDGEQSGTWGATTNTNLELISEALSFGTEGITTNADSHTTAIADGASDPGRSLYLKYTGTLDSACTITITPAAVSKVWYIENGTSGSQSIIISCGSGANVTIKTGKTKIVYSDGSGAMAEIGTLGVTNLAVDTNATVGGTLGVTGVLTGTSLDISGNVDIDGTTNLDAVDIDGAVQLDATLTVGANDQGYDVTLHGDTAARNVKWDSSVDSLLFTDSAKILMGASSDLSLYHDGSNSYLQDGGTGYLVITSNGPGVRINSDTGEVMADFTPNGAATLYHNNAAKLATTATGAAITGAVKPTTYQETYVAKSAASTVTCDLATATSFSLTMAQNTTFAFTNPPSSGTAFSFTLFVTQHSTAVTLTWPNTVDWAGGAAPDAAAANAVQAYAFFTRDGGTTYYGFLGGTAFA